MSYHRVDLNTGILIRTQQSALMPRSNQALLASVAIAGLGLELASLQYLLTGFSEEFGVGVAVGLPLGGGLVLLGS